MNNNDLDFYNNFFGSLEGIRKEKNFILDHESQHFQGDIIYGSKKGELSFSVQIPKNYPLNDLRFVTKDFRGYPHQNYDGSLCLNTAFINHTFSRLELEIEKFRNYIKTYYENESEDITYEYAAFDENGLVTLLFDEESFDPSRFNIPYGEFKYSLINTLNGANGKISHITAFAQSLANGKNDWSSKYKSKPSFTGCWIFLPEEPNEIKKFKFTSWEQLVPHIPQKFNEYFQKFCSRTPNYKLCPRGMQENLLIAIGYKIPGIKASFEVHWDLALLPKQDFKRKNCKSSHLLLNYKENILWEKTHNVSYNRFFGRGGLTKKLADRKILIIGNGAIGSSLAEILTRGGALQIDLADIDTVEPGNICRSSYVFEEVSFSKPSVLRERLSCISPFIEIGVYKSLKADSEKSNNYYKTKDELNNYDIIFDCTANNQMIQMLTSLQLSSTVYYLSVSNKALEMVCVCNKDNNNIVERRNQMLYSFGKYEQAQFREGTGCWHPTFEASYFDINSLLNLTVRKINSIYKSSLPPRTFYTYYSSGSLLTSEDVKLIQPELNLTLTIETKCLEQIEEHSRSHFPLEYGGVLIGSYLNDYKDVVISKIVCPNGFKNSPTKFESDYRELNRRLLKIYDEFDGKLEYIGDWHSHPNSTNHYSSADLVSITNVAKSPSVNTHNPILLIAACGKNYFDLGFYVYKDGKLYKFKFI